MDYLIGLFEKSFDVYFICLIIFGNNFLCELGFYSKLMDKIKKVYVTAINSILLGILYYYAVKFFGNNDLEVKALLNSYFLSTSLYELGARDVIEYLRNNGSKILINKLKANAGDSNENTQQQ